MKRISILGIDIAKEVFQLHGNDERGKKVLGKRLKRSELFGYVAKLPKCVIGMEACGGSNYWAREFKKLGHEVKLVSPQYVKPYVKRDKNDAKDAEAIAEAVSRPQMRFVPIKEEWQQDIQCLHRIRARLVESRTAVSNELRGLLGEYGIVVKKGISILRREAGLLIEDAENGLSDLLRELMRGLLEELRELDEKVARCDEQVGWIYGGNEACQRIGKVEGVGPITATAIVSAVGDPRVFKNGRQLSAWLGLVPRQHSSGGKPVLLGISKRGDKYIRTLLIHGARAVLRKAGNKGDKRSRWIQEKQKTRGFNRTCVALANKNARIIWALLARREEYRKAA